MRKPAEKPTKIICPLYRSYTAKSIICKGHIPDSETELRFRAEAYKDQQQELYCMGCYKMCEQYRAYQHFRWEDE